MERKGSNTKIEEMSARELKSLEAGSIVQVEVIAFDNGIVYLVEYTPQAKVFDHVITVSVDRAQIEQAVKEILRKKFINAL